MGRSRQIALEYLSHLQEPFPPFAQWLNRHVRSLRDEGFPIGPELLGLHCPPSPHALSYKGMWAYGCHFRTASEAMESYVSFDCGIAAVTEDASTLDVGMLQDILLITYGKLNYVLMKGDWIKPRDQGQAAIKKDRLGFWSVLYQSRGSPGIENPFVFPSRVSQVFFIGDALNPDWKIVLRHEARRKRVTQDGEGIDFDNAGVHYPLPRGIATHDDTDASQQTSVPVCDEIVDASVVRAIDDPVPAVEGDNHLDEADYEDDVEHF